MEQGQSKVAVHSCRSPGKRKRSVETKDEELLRMILVERSLISIDERHLSEHLKLFFAGKTRLLLIYDKSLSFLILYHYYMHVQ